jgi:arabinofuranan 3-O-arabinosyltransferase
MFKVTQLAVAGSLLPPTTQKPPRSISMSPSSADARQLTVSPGPAAILDVKQNYNPGWVATIGHRTLHAVRLDGWQQGYMLPASASEQQVDLRFIPDETFRILLLFGGVLAMVLALLAVFPARRREVLADGADATEFRDVRSRSRARHSAPGAHAPAILWGTLVIAVAVFFVGGPVLAAVALLLGVLCVFSGRAWLGWLALGAETAAGVIIAYEPGYRTGELLGSGSYTAQALGAVAFIALALSLLPVRRGREEERGL